MEYLIINKKKIYFAFSSEKRIYYAFGQLHLPFHLYLFLVTR